MPVLTITKTYANASVLTETDLDNVKSSVETFINTTKLDHTNISVDDVGSSMTSVGANAVIASVTSISATQANLIADATTRTTGVTVSAGGVGISLSCGGFSTSATSLTDVTNLTFTLTTLGKPVVLMLVNDGTTSNDGVINATKTTGNSFNIATMEVALLRDGSIVSINKLSLNVGANQTSQFTIEAPCSSIAFLDTPAAGTYTWKIQIKAANSESTATLNYAKLIGWELGR